MVEVVAAAGDLLGEGPVWDPASRRLWWLDIKREQLHSLHPDGRLEDVTLPSAPGPLALGTEGLVTALAAVGVVLLDDEGRVVRQLADLEPDRPGNRLTTVG
jgi:sugar lactone lactonase YvrE